MNVEHFIPKSICVMYFKDAKKNVYYLFTICCYLIYYYVCDLKKKEN